MATSQVRKKLSALKVVELRIEAGKRGLEKTGVKTDLVARLETALRSEGKDPEEYEFTLNDESAARQKTKEENNAKTSPEKSAPSSASCSSSIKTDIKEEENLVDEDNKSDISLEEIPLDINDVDELLINDDPLINTENTEKIENEDSTTTTTTITTNDETKVEVKTVETAEDDKNNSETIQEDKSTKTPEPDNDELVATENEKNLTAEPSIDQDVLSTIKTEEALETNVDKPNDDDNDAAAAATTDNDNNEIKTEENIEKDEKDVVVDESDKEKVVVDDDKLDKSEKSESKKSVTTENKTTTHKELNKLSTSAKEKRTKVFKRVPGRSLWITNLLPDFRAQKLKQLFSPYGNVICAKIVQSSRLHDICYGYVTMDTKTSAAICIAKLNQSRVNNRTIEVLLDKSAHDNVLNKLLKRNVTTESEKKKQILVKIKKKDTKASSVKSKITDSKTKTEKVQSKSESATGGSDKSKKDASKSEQQPQQQQQPHQQQQQHHHHHQRASSKSSRPKESKERESNQVSMTKYKELQRELDRYRESERSRHIREEKTRRDLVRIREIESLQRRQAMRLKREKDEFRRERERWERQKDDTNRADRERQRIEREKIEQERHKLRQEQMKFEEMRRSLKRVHSSTASSSSGKHHDSKDERKHMMSKRRYEEPPMPPQRHSMSTSDLDVSKSNDSIKQQLSYSPMPTGKYMSKHDNGSRFNFDYQPTERFSNEPPYPLIRDPGANISTSTKYKSPTYQSQEYERDMARKMAKKKSSGPSRTTREGRYQNCDNETSTYYSDKEAAKKRSMQDTYIIKSESRPTYEYYSPENSVKKEERYYENSNFWHSTPSANMHENMEFFKAPNRDTWPDKKDNWRSSDKKLNDRWSNCDSAMGGGGGGGGGGSGGGGGGGGGSSSTFYSGPFFPSSSQANSSNYSVNRIETLGTVRKY